MLYCLNPSCHKPENSDSNEKCHGCGEDLSQSSQEYIFQLRYKIVKKLGEGAFGRTYLAHDLHLMNETRVIKKLVTSMQGSGLERAKELFKREAKRLYELQHEQIPKLYAYFEDNDDFYLVQEFIEGNNLWDEVWRKGRFSQKKIRQLLIQLLFILDYLHKQKILHRDIKPANIMRRLSSVSCKKNRKTQLVLIDFGASKQLNTTMNPLAASIIYTPGYAPIEQMQGRPQPASDIYSLGVTAVRLLTQCFPNNEIDEYGNRIDKLLDESQTNWRWKEYAQEQKIEINQGLAAILDKMLQPNINQRYQSAEAVLKDLKNLLNPQSIIAKSVTTQPTKVTATKKVNLLQVNQKSSLNTLQNKLNKLDNYFKEIEFETVIVNEKGETIDRQLKLAKCFIEILPGGIELEMLKIPGGTFMMGTTDEEIEKLSKTFNREYFKNESPIHQVKLNSFLMSKYPITQEQCQAIVNFTLPKENIELNSNISRFKGDKNPVERVSWEEAVEFCQRLSKLTQQNQRIPKQYRLPSEAEWEYACRAGTKTPFCFGDTITTELANYKSNYIYAHEQSASEIHQNIVHSNKVEKHLNPLNREEKWQFPSEKTDKSSNKTTPVGKFYPNGFGLYDMHGNVWEWCGDDWHNNYDGAPSDGSAWFEGNYNPNVRHKSKSYHVMRGGSWAFVPHDCRSAVRYFNNWRAYRKDDNGFRVVCDVI
ncbi:MAG: SUMF1/EgtB/PvdO family nonheme iron enzyme [Crocosphaera sp.]